MHTLINSSQEASSPFLRPHSYQTAWPGFKPRSSGSDINRSFLPNSPALTCPACGYSIEVTPSQGRDQIATFLPCCVTLGEGNALSVCHSLPARGYQDGRCWWGMNMSYWGSEPLDSHAPRDTEGALYLTDGKVERTQVFRKCPEIQLT